MAIRKIKPVVVKKDEDNKFRIFVGAYRLTEGALNPRQAAIQLRYIAERLETEACLWFDKELN